MSTLTGDEIALLPSRNNNTEDFIIIFSAVQFFLRHLMYGHGPCHFLDDYSAPAPVIPYLTYRHFVLKVPEWGMDSSVADPVELLDLRALYTFRVLI